MPRIPVKINPKCGERLKVICDEQGIKQYRLGQLIQKSEKTVSSMVKGHSSVTRDTAEAVVAVFPQYRIEWLLGFDDIKTKQEASLIDELQQRYDDKARSIYVQSENIVLSAISMIAQTIDRTITYCDDGSVIIEPDFGPKRGIKIKSFDYASKISPWAVRSLIESVQEYLRLKFYEIDHLAFNTSEIPYTAIPSQFNNDLTDYKPMEGRSPHAPQEQ